MLGRLLKQYGAKITGGLHLQMPDSIADERERFEVYGVFIMAMWNCRSR